MEQQSMAHEAFISHSSKDKLVADAVVAHLERAGIPCWVAPRDIVPGLSWAASILQAITACNVMVVIFSSHANESDHVRREIERAIHHGKTVVPFRIEDVLPSLDLEFFLSSSHWMDAITRPVEPHCEELAGKLRILLALPHISGGGPKKPEAQQPDAAPAAELQAQRLSSTTMPADLNMRMRNRSRTAIRSG